MPYENMLREYHKHTRGDDDFLYLKPVPVQKPEETQSVTWTFSVKNLIGLTMGSVTFVFDWEADGCRIQNENWGVKDATTYPTVEIGQANVQSSQFQRENPECGEGIEDAVKFQIAVDFFGALNSVPYRRWLDVYADSGFEWGPK
jgi:hypothetical protein